jgi:hypothetical protein
MFGQQSKRFFIGVLVVAIVGPIAIMLWKPQIGGLLFLLGLFVAARCLYLIRTITTEGARQDQAQLYSRRDRGQTIFVQLIDNDGNDLDPATAQARLAAANLRAGPRDTVIGVRRKVP